jgi:hypothetical protein
MPVIYFPRVEWYNKPISHGLGFNLAHLIWNLCDVTCEKICILHVYSCEMGFPSTRLSLYPRLKAWIRFRDLWWETHLTWKKHKEMHIIL